jgi:hypothetical protein
MVLLSLPMPGEGVEGDCSYPTLMSVSPHLGQVNFLSRIMDKSVYGGGALVCFHLNC